MDRKKILIPMTAALLAIGLFGATAAYADTGATASDTAAEPAESAIERVEANEPALPGGGNADADGQNVDNQFDGVQ